MRMIPPFSFGQFARLLTHPDASRDNEIHRILDRMAARRGKRVSPHHSRARRVIVELVSGRLTVGAAQAAAAELRDQAKRLSGRDALKLHENADMICRFIEHFDLSGVVAARRQVFTYPIKNIVLRIAPDLCILRNRRPQFTKLVFTKSIRKADAAARAVMRQLLFTAIRAHGYAALSGRDACVYNVFAAETLEGRMVQQELTKAMSALADLIERAWVDRERARDASERRQPAVSPRVDHV